MKTKFFPFQPVHEMIRAQATRTPQAIAVRHEDDATTYAELDRRAVALSQRLTRLGVRAGDTVAVRLPRSTDLVVTLLGVLYSGAAYVPLDPAHPVARAVDTVSDAGCGVLVTDQRSTPSVELFPSVAILSPADTAPDAVAESPREAGRTRPDDVAYVCYTSGSTGAPKGVLVAHRGFANYVSWAVSTYCPEPMIAPLHTSTAFDLAVTSLWVPLAGGGTVFVPSEDEVLSLRHVPDPDLPILLKMTPSHVTLLEATGPVATGRRVVAVLGGEQLWYQQVNRLRTLAPGSVVWNEYGPTETVVGCCVHRVGDDHPAPGPVPIGHAIDNTVLHVLDVERNPVRGAEPGELHIGGAGVAVGYHGRPDLTSRSFFQLGDGTAANRVYRTGDLVAHTADGSLTFLGRMDDQINLRGFRVEPAEVEGCLRLHSDVKEAAALLRNAAGDGIPVLVAYVVLRDTDTENTHDRLAEHLRELLPPHMVPAVIHPVEDLPRTANGKVDQAALPWPVDRVHEGTPPVGPTEQALAAIWLEVLEQSEPVGRWDDFFDRGGDSITALEATALIRKRLGAAIRPGTFIESSHLAELAATVDDIIDGGAS